MSEHLSDNQLAFLRACAGEGPKDVVTDTGEELERRGLVRWVYEGKAMQAKWRLTDKGRDLMHAEADRQI
jgi:DNA-binding HxlR family transcriptional regulator